MHNMFAVRKNILFDISVVTCEVSSCPKFEAPPWTLLEELTGLENAFLSPGKPWNMVFTSAGKLCLMSV